MSGADARRARALVLSLLVLAGSRRVIEAQEPAAPAPLTVALQVASDTILLATGERLPVVPNLSRPARVVATLASVSAPDVTVWRSDTLAAGAATPLLWDLRDADGRPVPSGTYALSLVALDSAGAAVRAEEVLTVTRLPADTQPLPLPLRASAFEPETLMVGQTTPWAIFIGASAVLIPRLLGRTELSRGRATDAGAWLVAGAVTSAGFVAFFTVRRPEYSRENADRNAQLRRQYEDDIAAVAEANAAAREVAPYRIQREQRRR